MSWGLFIHMEENSALISNFFHQPATILNIGASVAPKGWNTILVVFCDFRLVLLSLFYGALRLSAVDEASELEAPTNQNSQTRYFTHLLNHFALKLWSFRFKVFWTCACKSKAPVLSLGPFCIFIVSSRGSYPLKGTVSGSFRLNKWKT